MFFVIYVHFDICRFSTDIMLFEQKTNIDTGGPPVLNYESKVIAPRNPTLNRGQKIEPKVC